MNDKNSDEIAKIIRLVGDLSQSAAGRGDPVNEAYLKGIAEGLVLADLMSRDQVQMMTRWGHLLVVWWRNVVGIGCVTPLRSTLGALTACDAELLTAGGRDALPSSA
ncbi:hypothetical protein, partial [Microvirga tunisiensis]|uniref:hypothetical protein n=1 Tax=Microvirga tunisiensis TaxID=2108360 RepID=UPI001AEDC971